MENTQTETVAPEAVVLPETVEETTPTVSPEETSAPEVHVEATPASDLSA